MKQTKPEHNGASQLIPVFGPPLVTDPDQRKLAGRAVSAPDWWRGPPGPAIGAPVCSASEGSRNAWSSWAGPRNRFPWDPEVLESPRPAPTT